MTQHLTVVDDIASLQRLIDGPDAGLADFMADRPYLQTPTEARADLDKIIESLEDVRAGRVVPHTQILADAEERRRHHRTQAAE